MSGLILIIIQVYSSIQPNLDHPTLSYSNLEHPTLTQHSNTMVNAQQHFAPQLAPKYEPAPIFQSVPALPAQVPAPAVPEHVELHHSVQHLEEPLHLDHQEHVHYKEPLNVEVFYNKTLNMSTISCFLLLAV